MSQERFYAFNKEKVSAWLCEMRDTRHPTTRKNATAAGSPTSLTREIVGAIQGTDGSITKSSVARILNAGKDSNGPDGITGSSLKALAYYRAWVNPAENWSVAEFAEWAGVKNFAIQSPLDERVEALEERVNVLEVELAAEWQRGATRDETRPYDAEVVRLRAALRSRGIDWELEEGNQAIRDAIASMPYDEDDKEILIEIVLGHGPIDLELIPGLRKLANRVLKGAGSQEEWNHQQFLEVLLPAGTGSKSKRRA